MKYDFRIDKFHKNIILSLQIDTVRLKQMI